MEGLFLELFKFLLIAWKQSVEISYNFAVNKVLLH